MLFMFSYSWIIGKVKSEVNPNQGYVNIIENQIGVDSPRNCEE